MSLYERLAVSAPEQAKRMIVAAGGALADGVGRFPMGCKNPRIDEPFELAGLLTIARAMQSV